MSLFVKRILALIALLLLENAVEVVDRILEVDHMQFVKISNYNLEIFGEIKKASKWINESGIKYSCKLLCLETAKPNLKSLYI